MVCEFSDFELYCPLVRISFGRRLMKILPWCFLVVLSVAFACNPAAFAQGCGQVPTVLVP
jgi:hypothetical protein